MIEIKTETIDGVTISSCEKFPPTPFGKAMVGDKWIIFENQEEADEFYSKIEMGPETTLEGSAVLSMLSKMNPDEITQLRNILNL